MSNETSVPWPVWALVTVVCTAMGAYATISVARQGGQRDDNSQVEELQEELKQAQENSQLLEEELRQVRENALPPVESPDLSTSWESSTLPEEECIQRAERAFRNADFLSIEFSGQSVFGESGAYRGSIRCAASKEIIFFVMAGPSADEASDIRERLLNSF